VNITKEQLENEISVLQKASSLHAKYSIQQYKKVLESLEELEKEKKSLEKKVKQRTSHLETQINEKQKIANELVQIAKYDNLTGLPNRYMFKEELKLVLKEAKLLGGSFTLLFLDLDGFKAINDSYGHDMGDKLLKNVASILQACVRKSSDVVSRLGGDEFTIILKSINDIKIIKKIANLIIEEINKPLQLDEKLTVRISSSIGIYVLDEDKDIDTIISRADIAMYEAKHSGKNKYVFFSDKMEEKHKEHFNLSIELKEAYKSKDFMNYFHPIFDSKKKLKGCEVLLRWENNNKIILPFKFIHILEESRLILKVTFWQIEEIIKFYITTKQDFFLSFNLSSVALNSNKTIFFLEELIQKYSFDRSKIHFEIKESTFSRNNEKSINIINKLSKMGFNIVMDNFGLGFMSLYYLKEYPINIVKIDKEIVRNIFVSQEEMNFFNGVLNLLNCMDLECIIEGVETKEQFEYLRPYKNKLQGFYFTKPLNIDGLEKLLN